MKRRQRLLSIGLVFGSLFAVCIALAGRPEPFSVKMGTVLPGHAGGVSALGFAVKSPLLVSGGLDGSVTMWDVEMEKQLWSQRVHGGKVVSAAFSGSDQYVVTGSSDKSVLLLNAKNGQKTDEFPGIKKEVTALAVNWDGRTIAAAAGPVVYLYDIKTKTKLGQLEGHKKAVISMGFSIDGNRLTTVGLDKRIILWDVNTKQKVRNLEETANELHSAAFDNEATVCFLGVTNLQFAQQGFSNARDSGVGAVKEEHFIQIRDGATGVDMGRLKGHKGRLTCLAISPDLIYIASVAEDKTMRVWSLDQNTQLAEFGHPAKLLSVAFSPLGKWIAAGGEEGKIYIYNTLGVSQYPRVVFRGERIFKIPPMPPFTGQKTNLAVFPIKTDDPKLKNLVLPITDAVRTEFVNTGRFNVIDRENMERIAAEVRACQAGYLESGCREEMKVKGVQKMITGSVSYMGRKLALNVQLIDVTTGEILGSATEQAVCTEEEIDLLARSVAYQICAAIR